MNNAPPVTLPADDLDSRLAVIQEAANNLINPALLVEDIENELDILAEEQADPEAINAIHTNAITLFDAQERLTTAFATTMEVAQTLKQQREDARTALADLKRSIAEANIDVPEIEDLWTTIEEMVSDDQMLYFDDMAREHIIERIWDASPLDYSESNRIVDLLTGNEIETDHYLWDDLRDWMRRADELIRTGVTPSPEIDR
jgi:hypothetical protein